MPIDIKTLPLGQRKTYRRQDKFLKCYKETRSRSVSATVAGVSSPTITMWIKKDYLEFAERYEEADIAFCENLEQLALERVKMQDAKSNPVLLITLLNANLPNKYRPTVVMADDTAKSVLTELRQLAKESKQESVQEEEELTAIDQVNNILKEKGGMA
tara:strand:- start:21 stop:494 length:474 start_codon:yes stop_codon:yes gene_type:complete